MSEYKGGRTDAVAGINEDGRPQLAHVDKHTGHLGDIDSAHAHIHAGLHFTMSDYDASVNIASPKLWYIRVPAESSSSPEGCDELEYHTLFGVSASAGAIIEVFKEATVTADGTEVEFVNNKDSSDRDTLMEGFVGPTVSDNGTRVLVGVIGSGGNPNQQASGAARADNERILEAGASYIVRVTVLVDATLVALAVSMYEVCEDVEEVVPR
jgi:hypothetical protein